MAPTPETVEAVYNLLKTVKPFSGWKLPDSDIIEFVVYKKPGLDGEIFWGGEHERRKEDRNRIRISVHINNNTLDKLLKVIAHEMVHLRQALLKRRRLTHGKEFKKLSARVCKSQEWDKETF